MKKLIITIGLALAMGACATGGGLSTGQTTTQTSSAEAQAKDITTRMKSVLSLDRTQEDRVLSINVVNQKLIQRSRQSNDTAMALTAKENYHKEMKNVLSNEQFQKFTISFPEL